MPSHQLDDTSIVSDNNDDQIFLPKKKRLDPRLVLSGIMMFILVSSSGLALVAQNRDTDNRSSASEGEYSNLPISEPCVETPGNLIKNPSFENNLTNWKKGKSLNTKILTSNAAHCKKALHVSAPAYYQLSNAFLAALRQPITVKPAKKYEISFWAKLTAADPMDGDVVLSTLLFDVVDSKASLNETLESHNNVSTLAVHLYPSGWTKLSGVIEIISDISSANSMLTVRFQNQERGIKVMVDNLTMVELPDPTPTFEPTPTASQSAQKRVFVTSTMYDGDLGGASGADMKCQARAEAVGLGSTWKAWLSDSSSNPNSRFIKSSTGYQLLNGVEVTSDWEGLSTSSGNEILKAPINVTEYGDMVTDTELNWNVWTNTSQFGSTYLSDSAFNLHCNNFTSNSSEYTGVGGSSQKTTYYWAKDFSSPASHACNISHRIYCFEQ